MSEADLRGVFRRNMLMFGRVQRIESPMEKGIPDACVCLRAGKIVAHINAGTMRAQDHPGTTTWVEFKYEAEWPRRGGALVVRSFCSQEKLEQVIWAEAWMRAGGNYAMLLQVARDYILLPPASVRPLWAREMDQVRIRQEALVFSGPSFPTREVLQWLTR